MLCRKTLIPAILVLFLIQNAKGGGDEEKYWKVFSYLVSVFPNMTVDDYLKLEKNYHVPSNEAMLYRKFITEVFVEEISRVLTAPLEPEKQRLALGTSRKPSIHDILKEISANRVARLAFLNPVDNSVTAPSENVVDITPAPYRPRVRRRLDRVYNPSRVGDDEAQDFGPLNQDLLQDNGKMPQEASEEYHEAETPSDVDENLPPEFKEKPYEPRLSSQDYKQEPKENFPELELSSEDSTPKPKETFPEPELSDGDSTPEPKENFPEPELSDGDSTPEPKENFPEPESSGEDSTPEPKENFPEPELSDGDSIPEPEEKFPEPELTDGDSTPEPKENFPEPELSSEDSTPEPKENFPEPELSGEDSTPEPEKNYPEPRSANGATWRSEPVDTSELTDEETPTKSNEKNGQYKQHFYIKTEISNRDGSAKRQLGLIRVPISNKDDIRKEVESIRNTKFEIAGEIKISKDKNETERSDYNTRQADLIRESIREKINQSQFENVTAKSSTVTVTDNVISSTLLLPNVATEIPPKTTLSNSEGSVKTGTSSSISPLKPTISPPNVNLVSSPIPFMQKYNGGLLPNAERSEKFLYGNANKTSTTKSDDHTAIPSPAPPLFSSMENADKMYSIMQTNHFGETNKTSVFLGKNARKRLSPGEKARDRFQNADENITKNAKSNQDPTIEILSRNSQEKNRTDSFTNPNPKNENRHDDPKITPRSLGSQNIDPSHSGFVFQSHGENLLGIVPPHEITNVMESKNLDNKSLQKILDPQWEDVFKAPQENFSHEKEGKNTSLVSRKTRTASLAVIPQRSETSSKENIFGHPLRKRSKFSPMSSEDIQLFEDNVNPKTEPISPPNEDLDQEPHGIHHVEDGSQDYLNRYNLDDPDNVPEGSPKYHVTKNEEGDDILVEKKKAFPKSKHVFHKVLKRHNITNPAVLRDLLNAINGYEKEESQTQKRPRNSGRRPINYVDDNHGEVDNRNVPSTERSDILAASPVPFRKMKARPDTSEELRSPTYQEAFSIQDQNTTPSSKDYPVEEVGDTVSKEEFSDDVKSITVMDTRRKAKNDDDEHSSVSNSKKRRPYNFPVKSQSFPEHPMLNDEPLNSDGRNEYNANVPNSKPTFEEGPTTDFINNKPETIDQWGRNRQRKHGKPQSSERNIYHSQPKKSNERRPIGTSGKVQENYEDADEVKTTPEPSVAKDDSDLQKGHNLFKNSDFHPEDVAESSKTPIGSDIEGIANIDSQIPSTTHKNLYEEGDRDASEERKRYKGKNFQAKIQKEDQDIDTDHEILSMDPVTDTYSQASPTPSVINSEDSVLRNADSLSEKSSEMIEHEENERIPSDEDFFAKKESEQHRLPSVYQRKRIPANTYSRDTDIQDRGRMSEKADYDFVMPRSMSSQKDTTDKSNTSSSSVIDGQNNASDEKQQPIQKLPLDTERTKEGNSAAALEDHVERHRSGLLNLSIESNINKSPPSQTLSDIYSNATNDYNTFKHDHAKALINNATKVPKSLEIVNVDSKPALSPLFSKETDEKERFQRNMSLHFGNASHDLGATSVPLEYPPRKFHGTENETSSIMNDNNFPSKIFPIKLKHKNDDSLAEIQPLTNLTEMPLAYYNDGNKSLSSESKPRKNYEIDTSKKQTITGAKSSENLPESLPEPPQSFSEGSKDEIKAVEDTITHDASDKTIVSLRPENKEIVSQSKIALEKPEMREDGFPYFTGTNNLDTQVSQKIEDIENRSIPITDKAHSINKEDNNKSSLENEYNPEAHSLSHSELPQKTNSSDINNENKYGIKGISEDEIMDYILKYGDLYDLNPINNETEAKPQPRFANFNTSAMMSGILKDMGVDFNSANEMIKASTSNKPLVWQSVSQQISSAASSAGHAMSPKGLTAYSHGTSNVSNVIGNNAWKLVKNEFKKLSKQVFSKNLLISAPEEKTTSNGSESPNIFKSILPTINQPRSLIQTHENDFKSQVHQATTSGLDEQNISLPNTNVTQPQTPSTSQTRNEQQNNLQTKTTNTKTSFPDSVMSSISKDTIPVHEDIIPVTNGESKNYSEPPLKRKIASYPQNETINISEKSELPRNTTDQIKEIIPASENSLNFTSDVIRSSIKVDKTGVKHFLEDQSKNRENHEQETKYDSHLPALLERSNFLGKGEDKQVETVLETQPNDFSTVKNINDKATNSGKTDANKRIISEGNIPAQFPSSDSGKRKIVEISISAPEMNHINSTAGISDVNQPNSASPILQTIPTPSEKPKIAESVTEGQAKNVNLLNIKNKDQLEETINTIPVKEIGLSKSRIPADITIANQIRTPESINLVLQNNTNSRIFRENKSIEGRPTKLIINKTDTQLRDNYRNAELKSEVGNINLNQFPKGIITEKDHFAMNKFVPTPNLVKDSTYSVANTTLSNVSNAPGSFHSSVPEAKDKEIKNLTPSNKSFNRFPASASNSRIISPAYDRQSMYEKPVINKTEGIPSTNRERHAEVTPEIDYNKRNQFTKSIIADKDDFTKKQIQLSPTLINKTSPSASSTTLNNDVVNVSIPFTNSIPEAKGKSPEVIKDATARSRSSNGVTLDSSNTQEHIKSAEYDPKGKYQKPERISANELNTEVKSEVGPSNLKHFAKDITADNDNFATKELKTTPFLVKKLSPFALSKPTAFHKGKENLSVNFNNSVPEARDRYPQEIKDGTAHGRSYNGLSLGSSITQEERIPEYDLRKMYQNPYGPTSNEKLGSNIDARQLRNENLEEKDRPFRTNNKYNNNPPIIQHGNSNHKLTLDAAKNADKSRGTEYMNEDMSNIQHFDRKGKNQLFTEATLEKANIHSELDYGAKDIGQHKDKDFVMKEQENPRMVLPSDEKLNFEDSHHQPEVQNTPTATRGDLESRVRNPSEKTNIHSELDYGAKDIGQHKDKDFVMKEQENPRMVLPSGEKPNFEDFHHQPEVQNTPTATRGPVENRVRNPSEIKSREEHDHGNPHLESLPPVSPGEPTLKAFVFIPKHLGSLNRSNDKLDGKYDNTRQGPSERDKVLAWKLATDSISQSNPASPRPDINFNSDTGNDFLRGKLNEPPRPQTADVNHPKEAHNNNMKLLDPIGTRFDQNRYLMGEKVDIKSRSDISSSNENNNDDTQFSGKLANTHEYIPTMQDNSQRYGDKSTNKFQPGEKDLSVLKPDSQYPESKRNIAIIPTPPTRRFSFEPITKTSLNYEAYPQNNMLTDRSVSMHNSQSETGDSLRVKNSDFAPEPFRKVLFPLTLGARMDSPEIESSHSNTELVRTRRVKRENNDIRHHRNWKKAIHKRHKRSQRAKHVRHKMEHVFKDKSKYFKNDKLL